MRTLLADALATDTGQDFMVLYTLGIYEFQSQRYMIRRNADQLCAFISALPSCKGRARVVQVEGSQQYEWNAPAPTHRDVRP